MNCRVVTRFTAFLLPALLVLAFTRTAAATGPDLRAIQTPHYRIHTDLPPELADDLARRMEAMHGQYAQRLSDFKPPQDVPRLEVYLFRTQADYLDFAGRQFANTGGVFMSGRNLLAAFLEGQGRDALRRTLQHEAFHQFAHAYISPDLPVWLNEGLAQLFEEGIWTGSEFWMGQVPPRRVRQLQADLKAGRLIEFGTMTTMGLDQWQANLAADHEVGATQYNQSWAMVHFLVNAKDAEGRGKYRARFLQMLMLLHEGATPKKAFDEAFAGNVKGFQARFLEYARGLRATPEATLIENQGILADLLTELTGKGRTFGTMLDFKRAVVRGRYRLHYTRGQLKWHTAANPAVYFADLKGRAYEAGELYLDARGAAPLPDIVCRYTDQVQLRTRFHRDTGKLEHEVVVEPVGGVTRAGAE